MELLVLVAGALLVTSPVSGLNLTAIDLFCPQDAVDIVGSYYFRVFKETCYLFAAFDFTIYDSALAKCQQHGGTLAMPKTKDINDFLLFQMDRMTVTEPMWIGLTDSEDEGTMVWLDGDVMEWDNLDWFAHGLWGWKEDCVALDPDDGEWHDYICNEAWVSGVTTSHYKPFICQYTLV